MTEYLVVVGRLTDRMREEFRTAGWKGWPGVRQGFRRPVVANMVEELSA